MRKFIQQWVTAWATYARWGALCAHLVLLVLGTCISIVIVARALEPTNGAAGWRAPVFAVIFVLYGALIWASARRYLWARLVLSVGDLVIIGVAIAAQVTSGLVEPTIGYILGACIGPAALGLGLLWTPLPENLHGPRIFR